MMHGQTNIKFKKNQLDAQFIFSIFRQTPLHVSGVSVAHHQEVQPYGYNSKYQVLYPYGVPPDDGLQRRSKQGAVFDEIY
jgi:hypothetical protein